MRLAPALALLVACNAPDRTSDGYASFHEIWNHPKVQSAYTEMTNRAFAAGYGLCSFDTVGSTPPAMPGTWNISGKIVFSTVPTRVPNSDSGASLVLLNQSDGMIDEQYQVTSTHSGIGSGFITGHQQATMKYPEGTRTFAQKEATLWFANHATASSCEQRTFNLITFWEYSLSSIDTQPPPPGSPWNVCGLTIIYESTCGGEGWFSWWGTVPTP
ncbi:MAG TPA: hypothetical protein VF904_02430 [Anaeromyxobacteraceae bacterium]